MKGSRIFVESLKKENVDTLFCYPGGVVIPIFDELYTNGQGIRLVQPRHEQGGTHAADGYARSTGKPGVVLVTSGPGATNTVTGILTAHMDSIPLVVFTGQVPDSLVGTDAFQEADIVGISMPVTKEAILVKDIGQLIPAIKRAFHIAVTGRPGPVLVDITKNVLLQETEFAYPEAVALDSYRPVEKGHPKQIAKAMDTIASAKRPLILAGGGIQLSGANELVSRFMDQTGIPAVNTLMGHGLNPERRDLLLGNIGMHGTVFGNWAIQHCDVLIALGTRFSDRILGDPATFAPHAQIVHVDIDPAEIGKNVEVAIPIVGDLIHVVENMLTADVQMVNHDDWLTELDNQRRTHPLSYKHDGKLKPQYVMEQARHAFPDDVIVVTDVGQHQMWAHQYFDQSAPRSFLSSGGLGTMGFGLPAGIGAKLGNPDKEILVIAGDGGFQMTLSELATVKREKLSIKIIVLDNNFLGMVRQWQDLFFDKRYSEVVLDENPDFADLAKVMGLKAEKVTRPEEVADAVEKLANSKEAMLLHVKIEPEENVFPMVPAGKSLDDTRTE